MFLRFVATVIIPRAVRCQNGVGSFKQFGVPRPYGKGVIGSIGSRSQKISNESSTFPSSASSFSSRARKDHE